MAFGITDLKKGTLFQYEGVPYKVIEYAQKVMGRGGSIVNVKIKSLIDGRVLDKTFKGNEQVESADVSSRNVQFLYKDDHSAHFMDENSYEQFEMSLDDVSDQIGFMKEGSKLQAQFYESRVITVELPKNVLLEVVHAEDVVKGDTTSSVQKDAELETGISIKVPSFVKTGDIVSVDTANGNYRERAK